MRALILVAALGLGACATVPSVPASPSAIANGSVLDEQAGTGAEIAYKAFRVGVTTFIKAGMPGIVEQQKATVAGRLRTLNNQAYTWLATVRRAYKAGNASTYNDALSEMYASIAEGYNYLGR